MKQILILTLLTLALTGCVLPAPVALQPVAPVMDGSTPPTENLTGCVDSFDAEIDYFPQKVQPEHAAGWTVEYHNHYKVLTLLDPWAEAELFFQYVLVQCGTPAPEGYPDAAVIEIPVQRVAVLTSTELPHLNALAVLDRLVAVEEFDYVNTPAVRELIDGGALQEVGGGADVNVEMLIDLTPDLVVTFAYGNPDFDAHPKLIEAGLPVVLNAGYMETTPLGRSEWVKVTALFFNAEDRATSVFTEIAAQYAEMAKLAAAVMERPTVLVGIARGDGWRVPGGGSYFARYIADAGGAYLWADNDATGSLPLDFEVVFDRARDADFWIPNTGTWFTLADVAAADERYTEFAPYTNATLYNNNANLNEWGGNDYWETGVANPHLVLADLLKIFHPDLLPDHELIWFQQLTD
ncbi:ABC transporter substrate-binding protein [bacterium]|nr:ABC transporter substrate-binding protein [bacterium]